MSKPKIADKQIKALREFIQANFEQGDKVLVIRTWQQGECGFIYGCTRAKRDAVGEVFTIRNIYTVDNSLLCPYIALNGFPDANNYFPPFALQKVEPEPEPEPIVIEGENIVTRNPLTWVTPDDAEEAAKKGLLAAVKSSIEHHEQLAFRPPEVLIEKFETEDKLKDYIRSSYCALCHWTRMKSRRGYLTTRECHDFCPLFNARPIPVPMSSSCCPEWSKVSKTLTDVKNKLSLKTIEAFQEKEKPLLLRLMRLRDKLERRTK